MPNIARNLRDRWELTPDKQSLLEPRETQDRLAVGRTNHELVIHHEARGVLQRVPLSAPRCAARAQPEREYLPGTIISDHLRHPLCMVVTEPLQLLGHPKLQPRCLEGAACAVAI
jgi:hypothetical protein